MAKSEMGSEHRPALLDLLFRHFTSGKYTREEVARALLQRFGDAIGKSEPRDIYNKALCSIEDLGIILKNRTDIIYYRENDVHRRELIARQPSTSLGEQATSIALFSMNIPHKVHYRIGRYIVDMYFIHDGIRYVIECQSVYHVSDQAKIRDNTKKMELEVQGYYVIQIFPTASKRVISFQRACESIKSAMLNASKRNEHITQPYSNEIDRLRKRIEILLQINEKDRNAYTQELHKLQQQHQEERTLYMKQIDLLQQTIEKDREKHIQALCKVREEHKLELYKLQQQNQEEHTLHMQQLETLKLSYLQQIDVKEEVSSMLSHSRQISAKEYQWTKILSIIEKQLAQISEYQELLSAKDAEIESLKAECKVTHNALYKITYDSATQGEYPKEQKASSRWSSIMSYLGW